MLRRADHRPPEWLVPEVALTFDLGADRVIVRARLSVKRNGSHAAPLRLDGEQLKLLEVKVDGRPAAHKLDRQGLTLRIKGDTAIVETLVELAPGSDQLGLFRLDGLWVTQCEPQGFRRISFFPDRPDVRARWRVRIEADVATCPVLLSNGNPARAGTLEGGRHWAEWDDPLPKPSYGFALVAGELHAQRERAGETELVIWTRQPEPVRTAHAMASLKAAIAWDEARFGRRCDREMLNLVAVAGYGFGAVEAPGLNIFDAGALLADPETATDAELDAVAAIVAHEYLHEWSGNRVTIGDWFELTLKEGLTVLREQLFCSERGNEDVKRIQDVKALRAALFVEEGGGAPHPPRPEAVATLGDLYSATIYVRGAELVRMLRTIAGEDSFRAGLERYFDRHDGDAARCEDLVAAMEGEGLDRFTRWYAHAGTPKVRAAIEYDPAARRATVTLAQDAAEPLVIPLRTALFADGRKAERLLLLDTAEQRFAFDDIDAPPLLSINRGFSAPIVLQVERSPETLAWLAVHDDDRVARWEAMQELMLAALAGRASDAAVVEAVRALLGEADAGFVAEAALLPAQWIVAERASPVDPGAIHAAWLSLRATIGRTLATEWRQAYERANDTPGDRALRSVALDYLVAAQAPAAAALALHQVEQGPSMTERLGALKALADSDAPERVQALAAFHARWRAHSRLLDQWFLIQAQSARADTVQAAPRLLTHPDFSLARIDSIAGGFAANQAALHHESGQGYRFLTDVLLAADRMDPRAALRLLRSFARWRRLEPRRAAMVRTALQRIAAAPVTEPLRARAQALLG